MAGAAATGALERLVEERAALVAWLAARFRGRLSYEDAEDVVAEALPRLADDPHLPSDRARAGAYVRRALWRDGLDELRHRHGRDLDRREPVPLELAAEQAQPGAEPEGELTERQERATVRAAASRVLERLSPTEAKVLRLKFLDEAPPDAIADELGVTRSQYQRRLTAASRRALDALVDAHSGPACPQVRRLIAEAPVGLLGRDDAGRRDAHLDECVHCRAFSLRARGALELLPLPAAGLLERISGRLSHVLGRGGEGLVGLRDGHEVVAGSGAGLAGAGTALTAGLGAKVAVGCAGAAVAVMCAGPLGVVPRDERRPAKHARADVKRSAPRPAATVTARAAATAVPTAEAASPTTRRRPAGRGLSTRSSRSRDARTVAAREFGPEASVTDARVLRAATSSQGTNSQAPPPPPPVSAPASPPASSSFAGEFAP